MDSSSPTSASAPKLEFSTQPVLKEGAGARIAHYGPCPKTGEAVRDRIYVSSRTYKSKTECLQTRRSPYTVSQKIAYPCMAFLYIALAGKSVSRRELLIGDYQGLRNRASRPRCYSAAIQSLHYF